MNRPIPFYANEYILQVCDETSLHFSNILREGNQCSDLTKICSPIIPWRKRCRAYIGSEIDEPKVFTKRELFRCDELHSIERVKRRRMECGVIELNSVIKAEDNLLQNPMLSPKVRPSCSEEDLLCHEDFPDMKKWRFQAKEDSSSVNPCTIENAAVVKTPGLVTPEVTPRPMISAEIFESWASDDLDNLEEYTIDFPIKRLHGEQREVQSSPAQECRGALHHLRGSVCEDDRSIVDFLNDILVSPSRSLTPESTVIATTAGSPTRRGDVAATGDLSGTLPSFGALDLLDEPMLIEHESGKLFAVV